MNKILMVAAVAASFATAAHAQSSVTLYGVLDAGITYVSNAGNGNGNGNGKSLWRMGSGIDQSLFGLRGSEDLGGGLKGIFTLESGFNINNGRFANNGNMFNRQAFVGLSSDQAGTVTLGRQYDAMQVFVAPLSATGTWGGGYFAHPLNNDNLSTNGGLAANNTIMYMSPEFVPGLKAAGSYSFSNDTNFGNNRAFSGGLSYEFMGVRLGGAYAQMNNPGVGPNFDRNLGSIGAIDDNGNGNVRGRNRIYGAGVGYALNDQLQVGAVWTRSQSDNVSLVEGAQSMRANNYEFNAKYNLTPALGLGAAYTYTTSVNVDGERPHFHQVGLQADYALSKRTDVYAQAVYQRASGNSSAQIYSGVGDSAVPASTSMNQTAATVGVRHRF